MQGTVHAHTMAGPTAITEELTPSRATTAASALELPETLSKILAFVDEKTLRTSVVLVSRLWLVTSRHLVIRELVWEESDSTSGVDKVLERLPYAGRLCWSIISRVTFPSPSLELSSFQLLVQTLTRIQEQRQQQGDLGLGTGTGAGAGAIAVPTSSSVGGGRSPFGHINSLFGRDPLVLRPTLLQELVLSTQLNILDRFATLASCLPVTLTDLRLRQTQNGNIQLGPILQACPHLQVLHLGSQRCLNLQAPWHPPLDSDADSGSGTAAINYPPHRHQPQRPLLLTTLVLENPRFLQEEFEQFLVSTPRLRILKLINLPKMGSAGFLGQHQYDGPRLLNHLKALNIRLQGFHFSLYREAGANAALDELMMTDGMGAGSTEWDFANGSLTPKLMQHIRQLPNMVTSLTFHDPLLSHHAAMPLLHQYLCDHNSSHLLHLRAPQATYPIAHMDLFRRIPEPINILKSFDRAAALAEIKATPRGVWKCRNLETLHIGFEIPGGWGTRHQPEQSRVVFGYIARVLPRLCELFIHTQVENHVFPFQKLRLEGGFCLLAKLKWLERLQICDQRTPLPPKQLHDLEWMVSVGWTEKGRDKRRRAMAPWRKPILLEDEKEAKRVASIERLCSGSGSTGNGSRGGSGVSKGMKWGSTVDEALKEELRHLGRLLDVKLWLDEMVSPESSGDGSENRPWPSLRMIAIACNRVYGSPPLSEFYRLERAREYARYENRR